MKHLLVLVGAFLYSRKVRFAEILGVKPATVSKYESGILEPNIELLKKLTELFNISIDELLKEDEFDISKINKRQFIKKISIYLLRKMLIYDIKYNISNYK